MKQTFKAHVIQATKLELATKNEKTLEEYYKTIRLIVDAYCIGKDNVNTADKIIAHYYSMNKETTSYFHASIVSMNSNGNTWKYTSWAPGHA